MTVAGWIVGRYDLRSAATLISTGGIIPLPVICLIWPSTVRPGGMSALLVVWMFVTGVFTYTAIRGHLSNRSFGLVGTCGVLGICATALILEQAQTSQAVLGLVAVIPTIAAISASSALTGSLLALALACSTGVVLATAATAPEAIIVVGATVGWVTVPTFLVIALRRSLERTLARQTQLSSVDPLTNLLNRRGFLDRVAQLLYAARMSAGWIGILLIDVDHFKRINDALGHIEGDGVLLTTAAAIREAAPDGSVVCRFGGEEFLVMTVIRDEHELRATAERFRAAVDRATPVTVSIGGVCAALVTSDRSDSVDTDDVVGRLLGNADKCVYAAKNKGRNTVHVESMNPLFWHVPSALPQTRSAAPIVYSLVGLFGRQRLDTQ